MTVTHKLITGMITIVARTPDLDADDIEIAVTIPTFRRPEWLLDTLSSLQRQKTGRRYAVVVIENDAEGQAGAAAATPLIASGKVPGLVIIAHERGNCSAYNAGWMQALLEFPNLTHMAVLDDDEVADQAWIENLYKMATELPADVVGGPQVQMFEDIRQGERWSKHPVFMPHYSESGPVAALYSSGNLLISRRVLQSFVPPWLDPEFNFLGGGDSDFLSRAKLAGFRLAWCAEAPVYEKVPVRRTTASWVRARSIRNGVISTRVEKRKLRNRRFVSLRVRAHTAVLAILSPLRAVSRLVRTGSLSIAAYPVYVALGRILAEFGYAWEQYREPEKH